MTPRWPQSAGGVRLRPLRAEDLPMTLTWRNRDSARVQFRHAERVTLSEHQAWFARESAKADSHMFIVEDEKTGVALGQVGIYNIDLGARNAEVGRFVVDPGAEGKGHMTRAIQALCTWASEVLQLQSLRLEVFVHNRRAIHVYEACGFVPQAETGTMLLMVCVLSPSANAG